MKLRIGLTAALAACFAGAAPGVAHGDVPSQWNAIAQTETVLLRPTAHGQARGIAMVQGAVYDAVNAIDRGHRPYLLDLDEVGAQPWDSQDAAAATAAYRVLLAITPDPRHDALGIAYANTLAAIPNGPAEQGGVAAGEAAAKAMLDAREGDGFMAAFNPVIGTGAGDWRPIGWPAAPAFDPDGWVANLKPFVIARPIGTRRTERAHEPGVREGLRGGEGARRDRQRDAHRRPDRRCRVLAVRADRALEPSPARSGEPVRTGRG